MRVSVCLCFLFAAQLAHADPTKDLFEALASSDLEKARLALLAGANPNGCNDDGQTPLHVAARMGDYRPIHPLVVAGANLNRANPQGQAPVHIAAELGHRNELEELIRLGANLDLLNQAGLTARQVALAAQQPEIEDLFTNPERLAELLAEAEARRQDAMQRAQEEDALEAFHQRAEQVRADGELALRFERENGAALLSMRRGWFTAAYVVPAAALALLMGLVVVKGGQNNN